MVCSITGFSYRELQELPIKVYDVLMDLIEEGRIKRGIF